MADNGQIDRADALPQEMGDRPTIAPAVDIFENADEYMVIADVPGVTDDALEINLDRGELTLVARRRPNNGNYVAQEFHNLDFRRAFRVPETIDSAKVEAHLEHGVLTVHLPKSDSIKPRRVTVKAG